MQSFEVALVKDAGLQLIISNLLHYKIQWLWILDFVELVYIHLGKEETATWL
jgi:hypothetical protein